MDNISEIKSQAMKLFKFDIGRNVGVEFISCIVKFAVLFAIATIYITFLATLGDFTTSWPITLFFALLLGVSYFFVLAPINFGRNLYFTKVAEKKQPETDEVFHFYREIKTATFAYFRIALASFFYAVVALAVLSIYIKIYMKFGSNYLSVANLLVVLLILGLFGVSLLYTKTKYSVLSVVYNKFGPGKNPVTFVSKSLRYSRGMKRKLFKFHLNFAGWYALCILSFGIAGFWIMPYIRIASKIFLNENIK